MQDLDEAANLKNMDIEYINCIFCNLNDTDSLFEIKERLFGRKKFAIVRCKSCGLIYTNPRPVAKQMNKYYPEHYPPFQFSYPHPLFPPENSGLRRVKNNLKKRIFRIHYGYFTNTETDSFKNTFLRAATVLLKYRIGWIFPPYRKAGKVLDIGCATGHYLAKLRDLGWETYGIEPDPKSSSWARERLGLNVITGKLEDGNFPEDYFDVVTLWHTLEHVYDPLSTLKEIYRILKKEGLIILEIPNIATYEKQIFGKWWWAWEVPRHLYHFSPRTITKFLNKEKFKIMKIEYPPSTYNIISSLRNLLLDYFPKEERWIRSFFDPDDNAKLQLFLMPLGCFFSLIKQVGRMVVYGKK